MLTTIAMLLCSIIANAHDFEVDGIYYNILSEEEKTVEVVAYSDWSESDYSGNIEIPETVCRWWGTEYSVVAIGKNAFRNCQLENITLPKTIRIIGDYAFEYCKSNNISLPETLKRIGDNAFSYCSGLYSQKISQEIEYIGEHAFSYSDFGGSLTIPTSCKYIGKFAFTHTNIENLYFKQEMSLNTDNLCIIGDGAFLVCNLLTKVNLKGLYYNFGLNPFASCENLKEIEGWNGYVRDTLYTINDGCIYRYNINTKERELLCCPAGKDNHIFCSDITSIGNWAFRGCKRITVFNIPNTVKKIGDYGLAMENETDTYCKVIIPKSVEEIGKDAFGWFRYNWDIYIYNANIRMSSPSIIRKYGNIHIPSGTKESFKHINDICFNIIDDIVIKYNITYKVDGEVYKTETVEYGATIEPIETPIKEGHTFSGWSEIPATMPAKDIVIEGTFSINSYTLTYKVDGAVYKTETVAYGTTITPIAAPTKEGHTFSGWSEIPATMPANDIVIEGSFSINSYTVTFMVDGEVYKTETVKYGATIEPFEAPIKEGHTFSGWSEIPATMPAKDVVIEGSFSINSYTVTFMVDGELYETVTVEYGAEIELPTPPEKEGYIFTGWIGVPATMPAEDIVIEGRFEVDTTGINAVTLYLEKNEVYNLKGQRITESENLTRGIYIVNGKKVYIK